MSVSFEDAISRPLSTTSCISLTPGSDPQVEKSYSRTWRDRNPEYTYSLVGDDEAMEFVEEAYPALTKVYASLRS